MTSLVQTKRCKMILQNIIAFRIEDPDEFNRQIDQVQDVIWTLEDIETCHKLLDDHEVPNDPHAENELRNRIGWLAVTCSNLRDTITSKYSVQQNLF